MTAPSAGPGGARVQLAGLGRRFGAHWALRDVTFEVAPGRIQAVIGRSGAGKSTLFRCLATLDRPDAGQLFFDGLELSALRQGELRAARRQFGIIFQQLHLLASRTAAQNVALPLELAGVPDAAIQARVEELLRWVGLTERAAHHPRALSGGERQRVAIARALATSPRLLLCDEPTSALDAETTGIVLELLGRARAELGVTVILISHDLAAVRQIADRVSVLESGRLVAEAPVDEVLTSAGVLRARDGETLR